MTSPLPGPGAYQAPNRAHDLRTTFTGDGITIVPRTELTTTWALSLALTGYGEAQPAVAGNRVEYARGALAEWYVNDERGLAHGFVLAEPSAADVSGLVQFDLAGSGPLIPKLASDGQSVEFAAADGAPVLRYGVLNAADAAGKALRAYFDLPMPVLGSDGQNRDAQATIRISVDAAGATYPVTVDSLLTSPQAPATPAGLSPTPNWMTLGGQMEHRWVAPPRAPVMSTAMAMATSSSAPSGTTTARFMKDESISSTVRPPA